MKLFAIIAFVASLFAGGAAQAQAQNAESIAKAQAAATKWLALTDSGRYAASWEQAAALFKTAVTKENWAGAVKGVRSPLGSVKSRKLKSAQFTKTVPNAPEGEYVVLQFDTQFENRADSVETVTPLKDRDGVWRVSGYFIK